MLSPNLSDFFLFSGSKGQQPRWVKCEWDVNRSLRDALLLFIGKEKILLLIDFQFVQCEVLLFQKCGDEIYLKDSSRIDQD